MARRGARPARGGKPPARRGKRGGHATGLLRRLGAAAALIALGAGGLAGAAWVGLVPGVQLRQRPTPTADELPAGSSPDASDRAGRDVRAAADRGADTIPGPQAVSPVADVGEAASESGSAVAALDSAAGDALYRGAGRCAGCHGTAGEGVAGVGPSLRDARWLHGADRSAIRRVTAEGAAPPLGGYAVAMPAYGAQLTSEQLTQLAAYVWTLSHPGAVDADPSATRPTVPIVSPAAEPPAGEAAASDRPAPRPTVPPS